jgi:acetyl-CoA carboxylase biotin carboxyl carrier protein
LARNDKKSPPSAEPEIDARAVRDLARLLDETGLSEIEIEQGGKRIRVARQVTVGGGAAPPSLNAQAHRVAAAPVPQAPSEPSERAVPEGAVTSPMVGTAYLAADPSSPPFVKVGDAVAQGQTLLIIDAMKTMNEIHAPHGGRVSEILIANGAPVEYGAVLMIIE